MHRVTWKQYKFHQKKKIVPSHYHEQPEIIMLKYAPYYLKASQMSAKNNKMQQLQYISQERIIILMYKLP